MCVNFFFNRSIHFFKLWKTTFWNRYETRSYEDALKRYKREMQVQTYDNPAEEISGIDKLCIEKHDKAF